MSAALAALLIASGVALAAPEEDVLGKAEGYPSCGRDIRPEQKCLVHLLSHYDELFESRRVPRGPDVRPLPRVASEPAIRYSSAGQTATIDDFLARNRTTGLLIVQNGTVLVERYQYDREPSHRMASFSMAKSIVGMLVGIAVADGKIRSLDDPAELYVPALKGSPYGETPIRHLLTMSSGVKFSETYSGFDDVATLAKLSLLRDGAGGAATVRPFTTRERPAGQRFSYSSAETQVLGLVLRGATGEPLAEYASRKLWQPMGAEADASWVIDGGGYEVAFAFFNATLRDYARLGMLLADDGMRDGRAIIPASWVRAATTPSAQQFFPGMTGALFGYGYQTWIIDAKEREFMLRGLRGQGIYVAPKSKIVMVHTAVKNVGVPDVAETLSLWNGVVKSLTAVR